MGQQDLRRGPDPGGWQERRAGRGGKKAAQQGGSQDPPAVRALQEAEALQQTAERRRGREAVPAHEKAAAAFKHVIDLHRVQALPAEKEATAWFGLGESLQNWAEAVVVSCATLPDAQLSPAVEAEGHQTAGSLFQQAVSAYEQVHTADGHARADAAVNSGNALSSAAELASGQPALGLLAAGIQAYECALRLEEDAMTWSNLADALVAKAERLFDAGQHQAAQDAYGRAMEAYSKSCSMSSSDQGDDLPGLLHNWGVGFFSIASHTQDGAIRSYALEESARRLKAAIDFDRADVAPLNALGDVRMAQAEAASSSGEAVPLLQAALHEGYSAALQINARQTDALVGVAEVHAHWGKLLREGGALDDARQHFQQSAHAYTAALANSTALGGFRDRCDDLLADPDFASLQCQPWFQALLQQQTVGA
ncbi:hypothetical protein WJX72_008231 [[Myrmecia] bisecta]|uniref:Uncharacterized protein n=1 Tax=[Myrmecia] bisecta TaxID=41462 RepID=A0AAW1PYY1_9CHLO